MKKIVGNRVTVFDEEQKLNDFLKKFDSNDEKPPYFVSVMPMGGNRVLVYYPIFNTNEIDE